MRECVVCGSDMVPVLNRAMFECELCGHREKYRDIASMVDGASLDEFDDIGLDDELLEELDFDCQPI